MPEKRQPTAFTGYCPYIVALFCRMSSFSTKNGDLAKRLCFPSVFVSKCAWGAVALPATRVFLYGSPKTKNRPLKRGRFCLEAMPYAWFFFRVRTVPPTPAAAKTSSAVHSTGWLQIPVYAVGAVGAGQYRDRLGLEHLAAYRAGIGLYALGGFGGFGGHLALVADMRAQIQLFAASVHACQWLLPSCCRVVGDAGRPRQRSPFPPRWRSCH